MYQVLIADDEPIERTVLCKVLNNKFKNQLEIVQTVNGREAIELFEAQKFHIVFMDIEMPGINGLEAAERIRKIDKNCHIIFLTAYDDFSYAKKAITVKALNYLLKPASEEEIIEAVEEAIKTIAEKDIKDNKKILNRDEVLDACNDTLEQIRISVVREEIIQYIQKHYIEDISMQDVAEAMNYSNAYFCKLFKQGFHKSFTTYLAEYRIEKAKGLLVDITVNVKEISDKVGYKDSNYFAKVFKRVVGITPSEFRILVLGK
jgi:two-component system, response regulator YesN